jgi:hypothetical protein
VVSPVFQVDQGWKMALKDADIFFTITDQGLGAAVPGNFRRVLTVGTGFHCRISGHFQIKYGPIITGLTLVSEKHGYHLSLILMSIKAEFTTTPGLYG